MSLKNQDLGFVKGRMRGGIIALKGAYKFVTTEHSAMIQFTLAILLTLAGFYFEISSVDWMFHTIALAMVLAVEALNTAVEKLCDFVHKEHHEAIGFIKDIAAGGVSFAALGALIVELLIFLPKILNL